MGISVFCGISSAQELIEFNIRNQTLGEAFLEFSDLTDIQFFYTDIAIASVPAPAISGQMTIESALARLLDSSGFVFEFTNAETVRVFSPPLPEAAENDSLPPHDDLAEADRSDAEAPRNRIYEIITTSQRRRNDMNLQDVPVFITVLDNNDMTARNINNVRDLNEQIPNVSIRGGGVGGISNGSFVFRGVRGVTRYLDGVAQLSSQGALFNVLELDRIEVLKGPQGTLFGKNAMGGAIQYITQKPRNEMGGRIRLTAGSYDRRDMVANLNIPLTDTFYTKLTAAQLRRSGYVRSGIDNIYYGDEHDTVFHFQGSWQPSDSFTLDFGINSTRSTPDYQQANILYDILETHQSVQAYQAMDPTFTDENQAFGKFQQYRNTSLFTGVGDIWEASNFNLNTVWDINPHLSLSTITGLRNFNWGNYADLDATHYAYFEQWRYAEAQEKSLELQLQGSFDRTTWTTGVYFSDVSSRERRVDWQYEEVSPRPTNTLGHTEKTDKAFFGEGSYDLTRGLTLTLGIRYTLEEFRNTFYTPLEDRPPRQQITTNLSEASLLSFSESDNHVITPHYALQYDWSEDVMSYISYAEGFNGGGINDAPVNGEFLSYRGEKLKQFELGLHASLFDDNLRLNTAYFYGRWEDIQVGEVLVPGTITTRNAGAAKVQGFDAEAILSLGNSLRLNVAIGRLDSRYTNVGNATTITSTSLLAMAPDKSYFIGGTYYWTLQNGILVDMNLNYGWLDEHVSVSDIRLQDVQDAYGLLNASLIFTAPGENLRVSLFGTNLTDEWYQLSGFSASLAGINQGVVARPRELGVALDLSF